MTSWDGCWSCSNRHTAKLRRSTRRCSIGREVARTARFSRSTTPARNAKKRSWGFSTASRAVLGQQNVRPILVDDSEDAPVIIPADREKTESARINKLFTALEILATFSIELRTALYQVI